MTGEIWYLATENFDASYPVEGSWEQYLQWSKLLHLTELVSLDGCLNGSAFKTDFNAEEVWKYIVTDDSVVTQFFNSLAYVVEQTKELSYFNLLAVIREPAGRKAPLQKDFSFVGYDLVETRGSISALTNCGGFNESFLPHDLNTFGLVTDYARAKKIQEDLLRNNPQEDHADCYLYEVWRHKTIGRKKAPC